MDYAQQLAFFANILEQKRLVTALEGNASGQQSEDGIAAMNTEGVKEGKITFPLAAPGIVSTSVFAFINAWNDYMIAHTFMKDQSKYTLPVWLSSFSTPTMGTDFGGQMAASVTFSLPVVVFFMLIQRNIMKGVTTGAVK
mgnify:CR=1 FL=1